MLRRPTTLIQPAAREVAPHACTATPGGKDPPPPPRAPEPHAEVHVLVIEEEPLVHQPDRARRLGPHHHARARDLLDVGDLAVVALLAVRISREPPVLP